MKKILNLILLLLFITACQRTAVVKTHGISYLEKREKLIQINKSNKNDAINLFGQPSTKGMTDENLWIYIERTTSKGSLFKMGKNYLRKNNVLVNTNNKMNVNLTLIEANILDILIVEKKGASKSLINSKALGQAKNVDSHSIDSHIYRLRKKLDFIKSKIKIVVINKGLYQIL